MGKESNRLRDVGLSLGELTAPPDCVRTSISDRQARIQMAISVAMALTGVAGAGLAIWFVAFPLNLLAGAATIASFAGGIYLAIHRDYRWVELSGTTIRAKHLYTGRTIERQVSEIANLRSVADRRAGVGGVMVAGLLGRVRAVEVHFRDGRTTLAVSLTMPAMLNADEFFKALLYRMAELGEIDAQVERVRNKPLVGSVHWKAAPPKYVGLKVNVLLGFGLIVALLVGLLFSGVAMQEQASYALYVMPAQTMTLGQLIRNGAGGHRHLLVTDFSVGDSVYEINRRRWVRVLVALFDKTTPPEAQREIKTVFESSSIRSNAELNRVLSAERLEVICSATPSERWNGSLEKELQKARPDCALTSAWVLDDLSDPPTAQHITIYLSTAVAGLCLSIILAMLIFWKVR